jgi:4-amino-4-deoxy-L-arabinose transferase-like glycosyltransferase
VRSTSAAALFPEAALVQGARLRNRSMTSTTHVSARSYVIPSLGLAVAILAALTVVRLIGLKFSMVDLFFDEAQYWAWSREPAFGYFSKPPLLAWIIAGAESVCGSSEACIRAPAPILYFGTCLIVFAVARQLYDDTVAFFAAIATALTPGLAFSARIISTDVPLLFCWALALLAYVKLLGGGGRRWSIVLGAALGLGMLAKYAMIYFLLGVALAAFLDRDARALLAKPELWLALAVAALFVAPNIHWNLTHGLATFKHTGDNIQGSGIKLNPLRALELIASQFAVFGPVMFAVLLAALARIAAPTITRADRLMLAFAIPPLVLITATAIMSRAFANWAATAFISGAVVVTAIMVRHGAWKWLAASLAIGVAAQAAFLAGDARATRLHAPWLGDVYRRTLGWRALGEQAGRLARQAGARAIVGDQRDDVASLLYYWRDQPEPVLAWPSGPTPTHQFDLTRALSDATPLPILFVSRCPFERRLSTHFANVQPLGSFEARMGPTTARTYFAFKADAPSGPIGPIAACL